MQRRAGDGEQSDAECGGAPAVDGHIPEAMAEQAENAGKCAGANEEAAVASLNGADGVAGEEVEEEGGADADGDGAQLVEPEEPTALGMKDDLIVRLNGLIEGKIWAKVPRP